MKAPEQIHTRRLFLHRPGQSDVETIFSRYASDAEVTKFLAWPRHRSIADTRVFLDFSNAEWLRNSVGPYLIRSRKDASLLGATGLSCDPSGAASIGYVLAKDAWGNGYASEALEAMVQLAVALKIPRVYACVHHEHSRSARVLEKAGFASTEGAEAQFPNLGAQAAGSVCYGLDLTGRLGLQPEQESSVVSF